MAEPEIIDMGGMIVVCWPPIDLDELDWQTRPVATNMVRPISLVQDADTKTWLVEQDEQGDWREMVDGDLLGKVVPVRWAVPTEDMIQALAFG
jgi:hypothetical protein